MILRGIINLDGMSLSATLDLDPVDVRQKGVSFCPNLGSAGKWRAYKTVNGKNEHLGYYDERSEAAEAVRLGYNMNTKPTARRDGVHAVTRNSGVNWRATYMPAVGRRLMLGEYPTRGAAILVRDVVARRAGGNVAVTDYEMPLVYVSNAVARSFIHDRIEPATAADAAEYDRRVRELSGTVAAAGPQPPILTLPPELWRTQQPSRVGRSPFDVLP